MKSFIKLTLYIWRSVPERGNCVYHVKQVLILIIPIPPPIPHESLSTGGLHLQPIYGHTLNHLPTQSTDIRPLRAPEDTLRARF
jgi:hypothetical protein